MLKTFPSMVFSMVFLQYSKVIEDFSTILTYEPLLGAPLNLLGQRIDSNTIHNESSMNPAFSIKQYFS